MRKPTKEEFIQRHKKFEEGLISSYRSITLHCDLCIEVHRREITKKRLNQIANMNSHLWEEKKK